MNTVIFILLGIGALWLISQLIEAVAGLGMDDDE